MGDFAYSADMSSREWVMDQILLILDRQPCHGYELRRLLIPVVGDLELTKLYRWLHMMEQEGLVDSKMQAGPYGPARRVYRVGTRGESRLRRILRDAIGVVLHFYDAYRHFALGEMFQPMAPTNEARAPGSVLVGVVSHFLVRELELIRFLAKRTGDEPLYVLGDFSVWEDLKVKLDRVDGTPWNIAYRDGRFTEVWLLGVPPRTRVPQTVVEMKRVLQPGGIGRMIAPFVFFDEPTEPTLEAFIRITAALLFPELNVADGQEIGTIFERYFEQNGVTQIFHGFVEFWGIKESES